MEDHELERNRAEQCERDGNYWGAAVSFEKIGDFSQAADNWLRCDAPHFAARCLVKAGRDRDLGEFILTTFKGNLSSRRLHQLKYLVDEILPDSLREHVFRIIGPNIIEVLQALENVHVLKGRGDFDKIADTMQKVGCYVEAIWMLLKENHMGRAAAILQRLRNGDLKQNGDSPWSYCVEQIEHDNEQMFQDGQVEEAAAMLEALAIGDLRYDLWSNFFEDMDAQAWDDYCGPRRLDRAARLYRQIGNIEEAVRLYRLAGRPGRASRLLGDESYNTSEVGPFLREINRLLFSKSAMENKLSEEIPLWRITHKDPRQDLMNYWEKQFDHFSQRMLLVVFKGVDGYEMENKRITDIFRSRGLWLYEGVFYLIREDYENFDRVCIEEDELEVAALWYEQANMPERAAKIYDLMGQSGKSGKAQSEGAKQKPQDAAKPDSDSREESDRSDFDQPVCPQCGAEIKRHWTVCPKCDADLQQRKCRNCGEPLEPDWKRCPVCRMDVTSSE